MARPRRKGRPAAAPPQGAPLILISIAALAAFIGLAIGDLVTSSPTSDETTHLVAGYSYLAMHDYRFNPEHPPLLKKLAALSLLTMDIWPRDFRQPAEGKAMFSLFREAWAMAIANPAMTEWSVSADLLYGLKDAALQRVDGNAQRPPTDVRYTRSDFLNDPERMFFRARMVMVGIGSLLAITIFAWSFSLWGVEGATLSLLLFCLDPNFIAHAALVTTDVGCSLFFLASMYFFWRACSNPTVLNAGSFAVAFGLAQTAKFSAVLLVPILLAIAVFEIVRTRRVVIVSILVVSAAVISVLAIWAMYDFRFSAVPNPEAARAEEIAARKTLQLQVLDAPYLQPTGHFAVQEMVQRWEGMKRLQRQSPEGFSEADLRREMQGLSIGLAGRIILFANAHHLLPEAYLYGLAWTGTSSVARSSYLNGRFSNSGFPGFFLWTTLYKTPIPLIAAILLGVPFALRERGRWKDLAFVLWPAVIYALFAATSNLNIGHRHIFPLLPFLYILAGALGARWKQLAPPRRTVIGALALLAIVIGPIVVLLPAPAFVVNRHISYLNEIAGGPRDGWARLSDSNFDWGQDLERLAEWVDHQHLGEPINLVYFGTADPRYYGFSYRDLRRAWFPTPDTPGYFAISQVDYLGLLFDPQHRNFWRDYLRSRGARRVGTAGYSIFIYRIDHP